MNDRLQTLLAENAVLYGMLCRAPTMVDIELLAKAGYHMLWLDMEHAAYNPEQIVNLCRTITHLGMIPMVRLIELTRSHVQLLLDGGAQILLLPNARDTAQARELVRLSKYPPAGERGLSSSCPAMGYSLGSDLEAVLRQTNDATHLMVQIESDAGAESLEALCGVDGIDMLTVGPADWAVDLGLFGPQTASVMGRKTEDVLRRANQAGVITVATGAEVKQVQRYIELGVRIIFTGVDVHFRRLSYAAAVDKLRTTQA